ncbi:MAG: hypothetical protein K0R06_1061 [Clostridium sp.]|jgi:hypothetical protein|nr:hypothetical protein [Clostridium sp.]
MECQSNSLIAFIKNIVIFHFNSIIKYKMELYWLVTIEYSKIYL